MSSITVKKIKKLAPIVRRCLERVPECRDNDRLLFFQIWAYQNPKIRDVNFSVMQFAEGFLNGSYAEPSSISRCRQKLQELHPDLRGDLWDKRHNEGDETSKEINN